MPQSSKKGLQHRRITPKPLVPAVSTLSRGCLSSDPLPPAVGLYILSRAEQPASADGDFPPYRSPQRHPQGPSSLKPQPFKMLPAAVRPCPSPPPLCFID